MIPRSTKSATRSRTCLAGSKTGAVSTQGMILRPHILLKHMHRRSRHHLALIYRVLLYSACRGQALSSFPVLPVEKSFAGLASLWDEHFGSPIMLESSNRTAFCKRFFQRSVRPALWSVLESDRCGRQVCDFAASSERLPEAGSSSRSTHGRRMMGLRRSGVPMWTTQFAICAFALQHAESPCLRPGRDVLTPVHQDTGGKYAKKIIRIAICADII